MVANSLLDFKKEVRQKLLAMGLEPGEAAAESEIIVAHVSGLTAAEQTIFDGSLSEQWQERTAQIIEQRSRHVPLQYVLGHTEFMGMRFHVEPGVFIPRPDTEVLVEAAIELVRREQLTSPYFMDIGTGSGAIAIALANYINDAKVLAVEISDVPFRVAQANAKANGVESRIEFVHGDWRHHVPLDLDIIVSNPPYIPVSLKETLAPEVENYEPHLALFGTDEDGLGFYREMARTTQTAFSKLAGGWLLCELGQGQADDCAALFRAQGWTRISTKADLSGIKRVLIAHS